MKPTTALGLFLVWIGGTGAFFWYVWIRPGVGRAHWSWYIIPALVAALVLYAVVRMVRQAPRVQAVEWAIQEAQERPASFSVILFHGKCKDALLAWIPATRFEILETEQRSGPYSEVVASLLAAGRLLDSRTLWWAIFESENHTVLIDWPYQAAGLTAETYRLYQESPEATFLGCIRFADEPLIDFCRQHSTVVTVATWDRIAEMVILRDIDRTGVLGQTVVMAGKPMEYSWNAEDSESTQEQPPPDSALIENPTHEGLIRALERRGVRTEALFGNVVATAIKVRATEVSAT